MLFLSYSLISDFIITYLIRHQPTIPTFLINCFLLCGLIGTVFLIALVEVYREPDGTCKENYSKHNYVVHDGRQREHNEFWCPCTMLIKNHNSSIITIDCIGYDKIEPQGKTYVM